jgi:hypothetical protein
MDVYLIPVGPERYELYCEEADDLADIAGEMPSGFVAGLAHEFRIWVARIEQQHRQGTLASAPHDVHRGWVRRVRDRALRWTAERIAEQRLLWHLRRQPDAHAIFPDDLSESRAMTVIRRILQRDADRHRRWAFVHGTAFGLSGLLAPFPGPNVVAYYFAFRLVGHYLSMRGARHGLAGVTWGLRPSPLLAELRQAIALANPERERQVSDIASRLRLAHLVRFFTRIAVPGA